MIKIETISILFQKKRERKKESYPQYIKDCNLDQIIKEICKKNQNLEPYFYERMQNKEEVIFRQKVFEDFKSEDLNMAVREFLRREKKRKEKENQEKELHCKAQLEWYTMKRLCYWIESMNRFYKKLSAISLKSEGFQTLYRYLEEKVNSKKIKMMEIQNKKIIKKLDQIEYSIKIKWSTVEVTACELKEDYSQKVAETFLRFRQGNDKQYKFKGKEPDFAMNKVEEHILEGVIKLYPDIFQEMSEFVQKYGKERDEILELFCDEVLFYLAYMDYIKPIQKAGLYFCCPQIGDSKTGKCKESFDLGLANKHRGIGVMTNDFCWKENEKIFLVTGANQGGKTTYARMLGQIFHLTALGVPIPGKEANLFLCDSIFTHFEREEAIRTENGKLRDDLKRMKEILEHLTENSFLIMNETFSSATLQDALFLGKKIVKKILDKGNLCLFVTFLNELENIDERIVGLVSMVDEEKKRTYEIRRAKLSGNADAKTIAEKYHLSYEQIKERLKNESISFIS